MHLRSFHWADLAGVVAVRNASAGVGAGQSPVAQAAFAAYWRKGSMQAERDLWVVEEQGEILAYGGLRPWQGPGWLQVEIVVHPDWRERGLGRALLRRLRTEARARQVRHLAAVAPDDESGTNAFLLQQGFEPFLARLHMRLQPVVVPEARPPAGYEIRLASVKDSAALAGLTNLAYAEAMQGSLADAPGYRRYMEESGAHVWAAEPAADRQLVGLCEVYGREVTIAGGTIMSGHIASLAVHPDHRGLGLGRWLLATGIRDCLEASRPAVDLNVDRDNLAARHLYESVGFQPVYGYTNYRLELDRPA